MSRREFKFPPHIPMSRVTPTQSRQVADMAVYQTDLFFTMVDALCQPPEQLAFARYLQSLAGDLIFSAESATSGTTTVQL